ncbi:MAG: 50S ribosomal protein L11 methyltransferase, partial [Elusimicrobiota bacterium]
MKKTGFLPALAALLIFTATAGLSAQDRVAPSSEDYRMDLSTATRYIFSSYLNDTIVVLPNVILGELGEKKGDDEQSILSFMKEFPQVFKGKTVLDIGTGCGIIALYAAKLGAARVIATDIDPLAVENAALNARRLKLEPVIEARLVSQEDPSAYGIIKPGEVFDLIISNAEGRLMERSMPGKDFKPLLGLSILGGLKQHLKQDGAAVVFYRFKFMHDMMVSYARYLGYAVEDHQAASIPSTDWCSLYSATSADIARLEELPAEALKYPGDCMRDFGAPYTGPRGPFPPLWGKKLGRDLPGL